MIWLIEILLAGYLLWRVILPLRLKWGWKMLLALPLLLAAFKFHVIHLVGGPMFFSPDLPWPVLSVAAWMFAALLFFFCLVLAADIVRALYLLCLFVARRKRTERFRMLANRTNLVLLCAAAVLATGGFIAGMGAPQVREETVFLDELPPEADGMTIAVLADLHVDGMTRDGFLQDVVRRTNALNPDIIAMAGDFVDGTVDVRGEALRPLAELSARYGVFGVPGNHEYYSGYEAWRPVLTGLGIRMLDNEHAVMHGRKLALAGVTDPAAGRFGQQQPDMARALGGIPPGTTRVLLVHQPALASEAGERDVDLQISGHTHGGMMYGLNRLVAGFNKGLVAGQYRLGNMAVYVSRGTGIWHGFPIRLGVPAEIVLLHLRRK